jgi:hypothetical protein
MKAPTTDDEAVTRLADQIVAGIAKKLQTGTVDLDDAAGSVEQHHRITRLLERSPKQLRQAALAHHGSLKVVRTEPGSCASGAWTCNGR